MGGSIGIPAENVPMHRNHYFLLDAISFFNVFPFLKYFVQAVVITSLNFHVLNIFNRFLIHLN